MQPVLNVHGTDEQLELYALNQLPEPHLALLEEHLIVCGACREKLDAIGDFALGMRESSGTEPASDLGSFFRRRPAYSMAIAFAALLVVVGDTVAWADEVRTERVAAVDLDTR